MNGPLHELSAMWHDDDTTGILSALAKLDDDKSTTRSMKPFVLARTLRIADAHAKEASVDILKNVDSNEPCFPYFFYKDFSTVPDPNPNLPVTAPGHLPNFPAKMFAILSRPELAEIVSWMQHGRSWKVHKPREFEIKVIPAYFEHSKFSSFIRQANDWGFRRMISKGPDRNSYYHELFLRGLPHLIKNMKRPAPSSKPLADVKTEPDFYKIAEMNPLPENPNGFIGSYEKKHPACRVLSHRSHVENRQLYCGDLVAAASMRLPQTHAFGILPNLSTNEYDVSVLEPNKVFWDPANVPSLSRNVAQARNQILTMSYVQECDDILKNIETEGPCAPYFFYKDYSALPDPSPNVPVTAPGRLPNFPAKMFAILSRPELADIVSWMEHGRSWKVHKPREFEIKVIPAFFEHSKFSSFIRQANDWGFRRMISKGPDRNSYYHELFLRGLPHLLKKMKRPAPSSKPLADPNTEPDFYFISEISPLPKSSNSSIDSMEKKPSAEYASAYCSDAEKRELHTSSLIFRAFKRPRTHAFAMSTNPSGMGFDISALEPRKIVSRSEEALALSLTTFRAYMDQHQSSNPQPDPLPLTSPVLSLLNDKNTFLDQSDNLQIVPVHGAASALADISGTHVAPLLDSCLTHEEAAQGFDDPFSDGWEPSNFFQ